MPIHIPMHPHPPPPTLLLEHSHLMSTLYLLTIWLFTHKKFGGGITLLQFLLLHIVLFLSFLSLLNMTYYEVHHIWTFSSYEYVSLLVSFSLCNFNSFRFIIRSFSHKHFYYNLSIISFFNSNTWEYFFLVFLFKSLWVNYNVLSIIYLIKSFFWLNLYLFIFLISVRELNMIISYQQNHIWIIILFLIFTA